MEYKIEKNIPVPKLKQKGQSIYPFVEMAVGDSFFVGDKSIERIRSAASWAGKRHNMKFTVTKNQANGIVGARVWRIK